MSGLITTLKLDYFPYTRHKRTLGLSLFSMFMHLCWKPELLSSSRRDLLNLMTWCQREESEFERERKRYKKKKQSQTTITKNRTRRFLHQQILTWQHTRKMNSVMAVHSTFSLNWICEDEQKDLMSCISIHRSTEEKQRNSIICAQRPQLTFLSGFWISGKTAQNGLMTSKNLTAERD